MRWKVESQTEQDVPSGSLSTRRNTVAMPDAMTLGTVGSMPILNPFFTGTREVLLNPSGSSTNPRGSKTQPHGLKINPPDFDLNTRGLDPNPQGCVVPASHLKGGVRIRTVREENVEPA